MRGFLSGAFLGIVVSGVGLTAWSYLSEPVVLGPPAPMGDGAMTGDSAPPPDETTADGAVAPAVGGVAEPAPEPETDPGNALVEPLVEDGPEAPAGEDAVATVPDLAAPPSPEGDPAPEVSAESPLTPDATLVPDTPDSPGSDAPGSDSPGSDALGSDALGPDAQREDDLLLSLDPPAAEEPVTATLDTGVPEAPSPDPEPEGAAPSVAVDVPPADGAVDAADTPTPDGAATDVASTPDGSTPPETALDEAPVATGEEGPTVSTTGPEPLGLPRPDIEAVSIGVLTDRLPRVDDDAEPAPDPADAAPSAPEVATGPALRAYATPFDVPQGTPVMSVVLLDPGPSRADPSVLRDFPLPLSIAINPMLPGASEAMAAYRAAGQEVVLLTPLPDGATPADVEQAFQVYFAALPEAVALLDVPEARLQTDRTRASQVADIIGETGHGLITYESGLNSGLQVARAAGVPATTVFRDFDDGIQPVGAMKRLLDAGAFRGSQQGTVVLTGMLRPEAITALAEWALGSRAATVTLAPVSALLLSVQ